MPRSRAEIQKDVNTNRAGVESSDISLNDPMWDNKFDPRYLSVKKARDDAASALRGFEQELAEAKARGEKGRSLDEIRKEISEAQSSASKWQSVLNSAQLYSQQWAMSRQLARLSQCTVNALQRELNEAEIEKIFEQEISSNPNNAEVYIKRGYAFATHSMADGENQIFFDEAIADFTKAIKIDPKATDAYLRRAGLYSQKNDHDPAIADYNQVLRIDPNNAEAYAFRGGLYSQKGKYDQASADFNEALRLNPQCKYAYTFRGIMYFTQGVYKKENADYDNADADVDKAITDIEKAVRLEPGDAAAADLLKKVRNEKAVIDRMRQERHERQERYDRLVQEKNKSSMEWYISVIKKYAVFSGRARRKEFWMFLLFNFIIGVIFGILGHIPGIGSFVKILSYVYSLALLIPGIAVCVRRLHDTNRNGLLVLLGLIPLVGAIILIVFAAQEGTPEDNKYGANPKV